MKLAQSRGNSDSQAQESSYVHWPIEQTLKRLAAQIIEHQHGPTGVAHEGERPRRPCRVELILQLVFVREAMEAVWRRVRGSGQHGQHGAEVAVCT